MPMPFERARTLLARGQVERRADRRRTARDDIEAAGAVFEALGARAWSHRAADEAARVGGRRSAGDSLTASERRVAELAAPAGRTWRSPPSSSCPCGRSRASCRRSTANSTSDRAASCARHSPRTPSGQRANELTAARRRQSSVVPRMPRPGRSRLALRGRGNGSTVLPRRALSPGRERVRGRLGRRPASTGPAAGPAISARSSSTARRPACRCSRRPMPGPWAKRTSARSSRSTGSSRSRSSRDRGGAEPVTPASGELTVSTKGGNHHVSITIPSAGRPIGLLVAAG